MLNRAKEANLIREVPRFKLFKEEGRALRLDDHAESKLLAVAEHPELEIVREALNSRHTVRHTGGIAAAQEVVSCRKDLAAPQGFEIRASRILSNLANLQTA
jgi:hypothetical protein